MTTQLLTTFRFEVSLDRVSGAGPRRLGDGGFSEVSGLEVSMDVQSYDEGGRNDAVVQRLGRAQYQPLVCKRGMFHPAQGTADGALWQWLADALAGRRPVTRYAGTVKVLDQAGESRVVWRFERALPAKVVGPILDAASGAVALEELHLAHEGLFLEGTR